MMAAAGLAKSAVDYVNPLIGTNAHGHVYPGATVPFGMVQLSPDTRDNGWDGAAGYHYSDGSILGFSHNHLTGTGVGDLGNILLMPTIGELKLVPGAKPDEGCQSRFSHNDEMRVRVITPLHCQITKSFAGHYAFIEGLTVPYTDMAREYSSSW